MRRSSFALTPACALIVLSLGAPAPPAQAAQGPAIDAALDAIAAYAPQAMREQGTPGLSVAITDRTRTLRVITLGYANRELQAPVTAQTRFAIGSITKSMTALALLQLHDAGLLDLNAVVTRYLPWFSIDSGGKPILVHQLLSHTAGIPDDFAAEIGYKYDILALRRAKTLFAPGTAWSYSNDGFATAGAILARLDRRPWPDSLQARVLGPIGMENSSSVFTPELMTNAAIPYQFRDNDRPPPLQPALAPAPPMDFVDPAGSVLSTPEDMARYIRFYLNAGRTESGAQLISPATFAAMTRPDALNNGKPAGSTETVLEEAPAFYRQYGYGLSIFNDGGDRVIGHTGGISGYTACMQMNLTRGFGIIAFANLVEAPLHPCAIVLYAMRVLRAQSLGQPLPPAPPAPDPAHVAQAADYAGTYTAAGGAVLRVAGAGDRLRLEDGSATFTLYPRGPGLFWTDDPNYTMFLIVFGRDANRKIVELTYGSQWYPNERYRGPRSFSYPAGWNALVGRYENTYFGSPAITRVVIVKNRLTLDGTDRLVPLRDGNFALGSSVVRFDSYAGSQPQRLSIDDTYLYRVELP
ncbi:MAG TPA: serine hydrolase domain-containing protein [Candidatus Babeliales bacterium]|nr:serine hydrolase domain-containing protein [Candidatus Babeliales bacterium]